MGHYFIYDENQKSNVTEISYAFKDKQYTFKTDNGLFSKEHVDYASDILMHQIPSLSGSLLDLGCGYGPIGIVIASTYNLELTMVDVNPKAIEFSRQNCQLNNIEGTQLLSNSFDNITDHFDTIILNPPIHAGKQLLFDMYARSYEHLKPNGALYIIIQKKHGAESSRKELVSIYDEVNTLYKKKGFFVFQCLRLQD